MIPFHHTRVYFEVSIGIEPIYQDFADLDLTSRTTDLVCSEDGGRTRDLEVMTLTLSQLSYLAKEKERGGWFRGQPLLRTALLKVYAFKLRRQRPT